MALPRFMVLKSNGSDKYLCYGKEKGPTHAFLSFSQEMKPQNLGAEFLEPGKENADDESPKTEFHFLKFEVEEARTAKGFVHIRTCYNNKYWVRESVDTNRIVAAGHEPEEDQTKWSCTLFKPILLGDGDESCMFPHHGIGKTPQKMQLMHISQLGQHYVYVGGSGNTGQLDGDEFDQLVLTNLDSEPSFKSDTFTAFDVEHIAILPEYRAFMGHDGRYIAAFGNNLGFITSDVGAAGVAMFSSQAFPSYHHTLMVRGSDKIWYLNPYGDIGLTTPYNTNTWFTAIKVGNYVALRCQANNNFVHRVNAGSYEGVSAKVSSITEQTKLRVAEPVSDRKILSANYDLDDSRTYDTSSVEKFVDSRSNYTSVEQTGMFEVEYTSSQTKLWSQSVTATAGVSVSWSFGVPKVGQFGIDISYERSETWQWGEEEIDGKNIKYTQNITIPSMKRVSLKVLAMKSFCDVPFTCVVRDLMTDGTIRQYTKTDGLFTGCNEYKFETVITEQDL